MIQKIEEDEGFMPQKKCGLMGPRNRITFQLIQNE